jgi:hypothetical protein
VLGLVPVPVLVLVPELEQARPQVGRGEHG